MPRAKTTDGSVDHEALHPEGVAGDPTATNPHEADPTPNVMSDANKRERVNVGITDNEFEVVDELPPRTSTRVSPRGRQLSDATVAALQFLRANKGRYCKVGNYAKPGAPSPRLQWAGYFEDGSEPDSAREKSTLPDDYATRKKIAYTHRQRDDGTYDLLLCLTDEDWTPPKKRGPRKPATEDINTTTTSADGLTDTESGNPNLDGDDVPVENETEPTEAQG